LPPQATVAGALDGSILAPVGATVVAGAVVALAPRSAALGLAPKRFLEFMLRG
jgi:hypothetical protein